MLDSVLPAPKDKGVAGGCLEAVELPPRNGRLYFPAKGNLAFRKDGAWGGAVSVWVNTDPNEMLKTPFCDPVLLTQRGLNNGSIFVHFNDAKPRALQAGTYPSIPVGQEPIPEEDPKAPLTRLKDVRFKFQAPSSLTIVSYRGRCELPPLQCALPPDSRASGC